MYLYFGKASVHISVYTPGAGIPREQDNLLVKVVDLLHKPKPLMWICFSYLKCKLF